jgi:ADP-heptose:LPS heptosyltransferase
LLAFKYDGIAWLPDEHEVARWCRLVAYGLGRPAHIGYPSVVGALPEPTGVDVPSGLTVLHCGAKSLSRRWPAERFAGLAILLRARGHEVVITGGPAERQLARSIAAAADVRALTGLTLLELTALVARARVVVCGDTGVGHVATNYGTPSVLLFGPVSPLIWGPPADPRHHVLWHGTGTGDPHGDVPDPALLAIDVHQAADAVQRAEAGRAAAGVPAAISA